MSARAVLHSHTRRFSAVGLLLAGTVLGAAGCAQQKAEGYYNPPPESTVTDSQATGNAAGYRNVLRAPSQLQIALKPTPSKQQQAPAQSGQTTEDGQAVPDSADAAGSGPVTPLPKVNTVAQGLVPQPQTYVGTLPCFSPNMQCTAQRVTLTLAPNGRWRGRTSYLENAPKSGPPVAEQGCWDATDEHPPRVILMDNKGNARAEFVVAMNNVLRVRSIAGQTPNLNYNLTRQPDLDPIDELSKEPALACP